MADYRTCARGLVLCFGLGNLAAGQPASPDDTLKALTGQIQELRQVLDGLREQLAGSQRESQDLRRELQDLRRQLGLPSAGDKTEENKEDAIAETTSPTPDRRLESLSEELQLLNAKVEEQYQTKVASGSKYRARLSGLVLFNAFHGRGTVDNIDLPKTAGPTPLGEGNGSFGASLRQSMVSLEVFGPAWNGAQTRGDLTFDFFGGFPATNEGITNGLARLRTASLALDWKNTSVVAGQDALFFSPLSPTSLVSNAYPALSSAGNLWTWTPQVYVEHRKSLPHDAQLSVRAGILDALTGEPPAAEYNRTPNAGERTRTPAYAMRWSWQRPLQDRQLAFCAGGYYSRQDWGFQRNADAWAATADWNVPFGPWVTLSGEFYRGRAIAGLGGSASASVLFQGPSALATSVVVPLDSFGGWSQLKFQPQERIEFNIAFGEDSPFRSGLNSTLINPTGTDSLASRNANGFLNAIFKVRSNLLLSAEYRRLRTFHFFAPSQTADHVSLGAGIIF